MTGAAAPAAVRLPDATRPLTTAAAAAAFDAIMDGAVDDADLAHFLTALAERGETVAEVAAAAAVLRARATTIRAPAGAIDVVGTGGDGRHTLNISTAVAIVVAACGVPVAKHGNRAASSKSGAADVLGALGVPLALEPDAVARCLETLGITFLHAARHHGAMARVAPVRKALGRRTIFNLLGPLANPAGVALQLVGVADARWLRPFAEVLRELGTTRAMIVHGSDGIDELTVTGPSQVVRLENGVITEATITPADAGLALHDAAALTGGEPEHNAAALRALLAGAPGAYRDIVLLNAAGALIVAGRAKGWAEGAALAAQAIDSGAAAALLDRWKAFE